MILIRGIKEEKYARKIKKGIVDCRDILSAVLNPPTTGYGFSDYYEKNLVKALCHFGIGKPSDLRDIELLYSILVDYYIPHIYLTYFHIVNEKSFKWLDNFDDDYHFIAVNVTLDEITKTAIGNGYFGSKMSYIDDIKNIDQEGYRFTQSACMCSLERIYKYIEDMLVPLNLYNTISFPLLHRETDCKFTDIENEFRFITYDCPTFDEEGIHQNTRETIITGKSGNKYKGSLQAEMNTYFESENCLLRDPNKLLKDILIEENGEVVIDSKFKEINIAEVSNDYRYLGGKKECSDYIKNVLEKKPKDRYVKRTVRRVNKVDELQDAMFFPGYQKVDY